MKKILKNNLFMLSYVNKFSKLYLLIAFFVSLTAFAGPVSTVLIPKLITENLIQNRPVSASLVLIGIVTLANMLRVVLKSLFNDVFVPKEQNKIKAGINRELMEKSLMLDLICYEDSEFYNKYTRALHQAENGIAEFIDTLTSLIDRFIYVSTVFTIMAVLDPLLILVSVSSMVILVVFGKTINKLRYEYNMKMTTDQRYTDYVKRIYYQPQYAKETRVFNIGLLLRQYYSVAMTNLQHKLHERGKKISLLNITDEGIRVILLQFIVMSYLVRRSLNKYQSKSERRFTKYSVQTI